MNLLRPILKLTGACLILALFFACGEENLISDGADDANQLTALKNVDFTFSSISYSIAGLPTGDDLNSSFAELLAANPEKYSNPAAYTISFSLNMQADNTSSDSEDAKFDGMNVDMLINDISEAPVELTTGVLTIPKAISTPFTAGGSLNLQTHKQPGKYIFQQIVDGNPISTEITPEVLYKFGPLEGSLELLSWEQLIPTSASPETKAFLSNLLSSGLLDD